MAEEFIDGEYYFRLSGEGEKRLEGIVARELAAAGVLRRSLVRGNNQYARHVTGRYHIKADYEVIEKLVESGRITEVERVPKVRAAGQPHP